MTSEDVAAKVLDLVRAASPSAEAEVVVDLVEQGLTRFANSFIHQNVAESTATVRVRLHLDGRTASGSTTVTDAEGLRGLVDRTVAAARLCPPDPLWPGLAPAAAVASAPPVDPDTAHAAPAERAARVRAFVDAAQGLETAGFCSTTRLVLTFANSAGQSAQAETTEAAMDAIARVGTSDGLARVSASRLSELDGSVLGARAAAKARAGTDPVQLPPGRYEVVLEPTAVSDLLFLMAAYGFNGKTVAERRSFVELGEEQFDASLSLVDDPLEAGAGLPFDIEGTPRRRITFIDNGVSAALAHDRRTAAQVGGESTGHAMLGGASWGAFPTNLHLLASGNGTAVPGEVFGPAADAAVAELVGKVGRGLLVTDNWYTRVLDPKSLVVTGLTRNGVWLIEDGQVTQPVQNMRFTQSYPQALAPGGVLAVGGHAVTMSAGWAALTYRAPALRLASWNYTGNAAG
jgi:predicted Zn-dependent protease